MRRTVTKLAMNKATFLALSNQMTEQLGARRAAPHQLLLLPGHGMACVDVHARAASRGLHAPQRPSQAAPSAPPY